MTTVRCTAARSSARCKRVAPGRNGEVAGNFARSLLNQASHQQSPIRAVCRSPDRVEDHQRLRMLYTHTVCPPREQGGFSRAGFTGDHERLAAVHEMPVQHIVQCRPFDIDGRTAESKGILLDIL